MSKISPVSPGTAIFRLYPHALWNHPNTIIQVTGITNNTGASNNAMTAYILEKVAHRMTDELASMEVHRREAERRRVRPVAEASESADTLLGGIFEGAELLDEEAEEAQRPVQARRLAFIFVNEDAIIRTRVFPRTFHCQTCGHLEVIDPERVPATWECPCCHRGRLRHEPIVFVCARCASIKELAPKGKLTDTPSGRRRRPQGAEGFLGGPPGCPECSGGHIHLEKHQSNRVAQWEWKCQTCNSYHEEVAEYCLNCALRRTQDEAGDMVSMTAIPAAAPSALQPLTDISMFIGTEPLDPGSLLSIAREAGRDWPDFFELRQADLEPSVLGKKGMERIRGACVSNAYLLKHMSVVTTVFGYKSGHAAVHPITPVDEQERHARFFPDPQKIAEYLCYGMVHTGAALVIEFDTQCILQRLSREYEALGRITHGQAVELTRNVVSNTPLRNLLHQSDPRLTLFKSLHAVEHAILTTAHRLIGSEVLESLLFFAEGVLLIYERASVGRGGVVQLVNQGQGLATLLRAAADQVLGCAQGCADGCPSCIYMRDIHCHFSNDDLGRAWLPANALLSRRGARYILAPEDDLDV